jgi:photosystem II stability/assembly factor-like uncharacterized protein
MSICLSPNGADLSTGDADPCIFVGTVDGVWSISGGDVTSIGLRGRHIGALLEVPGSRRLLAATYGAGIFASDDRGATWRPVTDGIDRPMAFSLTAQVRASGVVVYAGTEPVGLYRSDDDGGTWIEIAGLQRAPGAAGWTFPTPPFHAHLKHVGFDPTDEHVLYVSIEQGDLLCSHDDGVTWETIATYEAADDIHRRDIHRVAIPTSDPNRLYMNTGCGFYRSGDAGRTWQRTLTPDAVVGYPDPLFIDPVDEATLYLAGAGSSPRGWQRGVGGTASASVLRSLDGGLSWQRIVAGLPDPVPGNIEAMSLHVTGGVASLYLATTQGNVWAADRAGGPWRELTADLPPVSKSYHYRHFLPPEERDRVLSAQGHASGPPAPAGDGAGR